MSNLISTFKDISFKISDDIVSRKNSDGTVIVMKMEDGDIFYKMNGISASVFKEMENGKQIVEICENIMNEFNVAEDKLVKDVQDLMGDLRKAGIID